MAKQNQGFRKDLNLEETTNDSVAINNLAGAGIANDLRVIQNNLRNISTLSCDTVTNGFFSFPNNEFVFTNDDVVKVNPTVVIGGITLTADTEYFICNSNGETQFKSVFIRKGNQFVEEDIYKYDPYAKSVMSKIKY